MCGLTLWFFFERYSDHRELHVLAHSFPTRRSSDLVDAAGFAAAGGLKRELSAVRRIQRSRIVAAVIGHQQGGAAALAGHAPDAAVGDEDDAAEIGRAHV